MEAWNGDGVAYTVDRIGRGTVDLPPLCLSIIGGIQPGKLDYYTAGAMAGGNGADGLLQRFQLLVWPDDLGKFHKPKNLPQREAREAASALIEKLASLDPELLAADTSEDIPFLRFSTGAQIRFDEWRVELEGRLRDKSLEAYPAFAAHVGKYRSLAPSLALIFHLLAVVSGRDEAGPVSEDALVLALNWVDFLELHARKVYAAELNGKVLAAHALARRIKRGEVLDGMSVRDVARKEWHGLTLRDRSATLLEAALSELEQASWLRVASEATGGRDTRVVRLHPELREA